MNAVELAVNLFVTLFALIDPIGNVPIFAAATLSATAAQQRQISAYLVSLVVVGLLFFYFTGLMLLEFFGISLAAFRIAGGILLLFLGLEMAREDFLKMFAEVDPTTDTGDVRGYAKRRFQRLVVPFAIPLMIGPGAISAVIIQAGEAREVGAAGWAAGVVAIVAAGLVTMLTFWLAGPIGRILGDVGMAVVVRVLGLILCALAIQFIIVGFGEATYGIIATAASSPYGH